MGLITMLGRAVPRSIRPTLRRWRHMPADYLELVKGERDWLTPPRSLHYVGGGDFKATGREFRQYMIELGGLQPNHRILDVGCGNGRMAVPLTDYLKPPGEYHGFDIVKEGLVWCQRTITPRFRHFHFTHADIHNKRYNAEGRIQGKDFRFPFADNYFDFVLLTSVFTHMLPPALENYLSEISRVLRPGGNSLITWFLLNEESLGHIRAGEGTQKLVHEVQGCLTTDKDNPESSIGFHEDTVRKLYAARGMSIVEPIRYGDWCGRPRQLSYQDIVFAKKNA